MKKFLIILISLVLSIVVFAGCGTYQSAIIPGDTTSGDNNPSGKPGDGSDDGGDGGGGFETPPEEEGFTFTVTLYRTNSNGDRVRYYVDPSLGLKAWWQGDYGNFEADFSYTGVATKSGLDGEYRVTLSGLPEGFTYDPNGNEVDNDNRDLAITLLEFGRGSGKGNSFYNEGGNGPITINKEGVFKVTLTSRTNRVYYKYTPTKEGRYTIESMADIEEDIINPKMDWYNANPQFQQLLKTVDDGGASGSYTQNFKETLQVDSSAFVGNSWMFSVYAEHVSNKYPIDMYFKITYDGKPVDTRVIVTAKGPFYEGPAPTGTWGWSFLDNKNGSRYYTDGTFGEVEDEAGSFVVGDTNYLYQPMRFVLNADDGFYHFYDPVLYEDNNGWGPMLWTIIDGQDLIEHPKGIGGGNVPSLQGSFAFTIDKNYSYFMEKYKGYSYYVKDNIQNTQIGVHPVNEELMLALQELAVYSGDARFSDGDGYAEKGPTYEPGDGERPYDSGYRVDSDEDHMFLIFCGYFK